MLFIGNKPEFTFKTNKKFCSSQATFGLNPDFCLILSTSQTYYDDEKLKFHSIKIIKKICLKKFISKIKCNINDVFIFNNNDREKFLIYKKKIVGRSLFNK